MPPERTFTATRIKELLKLEYGQGLTATARARGPFPVIGSAGIVGTNAKPAVAGPGIVIGRKGNAGNVIWSDSDFWPIDTTYYVVPRGDVDLRWLYWALKYGRLAQLNAATGVPSLVREHAYEHSVAVPDPAEQHRIAETLDKADQPEQAAREALRKLELLKAGVIAELLSFGLDKTIDDIATHVGSGLTPRGGSAVYQGTGVTFIRSQNVYPEGLRLEDVAYINEDTHRRMSRSEIFPHDVLLNITGASIGRCCAFPEGLGPANVNQHVCAIRLREVRREDAGFLAEVLASHVGQRQIERVNAGGSREGLNYQQVRALRIPWPAPNERARIGAVASSLNSRIELQRHEAEKFARLRDGVAQDLIPAVQMAPSSMNGAARGAA
jgi:type I restriction enzyme S subunit